MSGIDFSALFMELLAALVLVEHEHEHCRKHVAHQLEGGESDIPHSR